MRNDLSLCLVEYTWLPRADRNGSQCLTGSTTF